MSLSTTFMNFTTGVLEADKKNTKENLLIRGKELDAKRNAVLEMKKSKYNDEIETYKKDKVKIDGLNAVQADWDKGKYKITKDGKTGTDTKALGYDFLVAKHGIEWVQKQKTHLLGAESDPTAWNAYLNSKGRDLDIKGDKLFTDFKERSVIDSNYLESLDKIEKKYTAALKAAKNDSSLINAILGKKNEEISLLEENANSTSKNVSTIESVNSTIDASEKNKLDEIQTDISTTTEVKDGMLTEIKNEKDVSSQLVFIEPDEPPFMPKSWKDDAEKKLTAAKQYKFKTKEAKEEFAQMFMELIPGADIKNFFEVGNDKTLIAKASIINADAAVKALLVDSLKDLDEATLFSATGNDRNKTTDHTNQNSRNGLAKNHVEKYGTWFTEGEVLGAGGDLSQLLTSESNSLLLPASSVINLDSNKLQGYGATIPDEIRSINANLVNAYTNQSGHKEPVNINVREYVGEVYSKYLVDRAKHYQKVHGIKDLEEAINILQRKTHGPNSENNEFTKDVRDHIAKALGITTDSEGKKLPTDSKAFESSVAPKAENMMYTEVDGKAISIPKTDKNVSILIEQAKDGNEDVVKLLAENEIEWEDTSKMAPIIGADAEFITVNRRGKKVKVRNPNFPKPEVIKKPRINKTRVR